jgi:hypothetical protein
MKYLVANQNIGTAFHHLARAAAVLVAVAQAVRLKIIEKDCLASFDCLPGIRAATLRVSTLVCDAKSRLAIHENVRRSRGGRANAGVRTATSLMGVYRHLGSIPESRLGAYHEKNITHDGRFGGVKWR